MNLAPFIQSAAASVATLTSAAGRPVALDPAFSADGVLTVNAIIEDDTQALRERLGQGFLDYAIGRVVMFFVTPADAARMLAGGLPTYAGEQYAVHVHETVGAANTDVMTVIVGQSLANLFPHRCSLYALYSPPDAATGKPQKPNLVLKAENVPCCYTYTDNVDDPLGVGRLKRPSVFTRDTIAFPDTVTVGNAWYIVNTSTLPTNPMAPLATFGEVHIAQGSANKHPPTMALPVGTQTVQGMTDDMPREAIRQEVAMLRRRLTGSLVP